jgi:hypothetical protein
MNGLHNIFRNVLKDVGQNSVSGIVLIPHQMLNIPQLELNKGL